MVTKENFNVIKWDLVAKFILHVQQGYIDSINFTKSTQAEISTSSYILSSWTDTVIRKKLDTFQITNVNPP